MTTVAIEELQTHLDDLLDQAASGEALLITRAGKPLVKIEAISSTSVAKPEVNVFDDPVERQKVVDWLDNLPGGFDRYMEDEIADMFEGKADKLAFLAELTEEERQTLRNLEILS